MVPDRGQRPPKARVLHIARAYPVARRLALSFVFGQPDVAQRAERGLRIRRPSGLGPAFLPHLGQRDAALVRQRRREEDGVTALAGALHGIDELRAHPHRSAAGGFRLLEHLEAFEHARQSLLA